MTSLPPFQSRDRVIGAVLVVAYGIAQAAALAVVAFATRDAFASLHANTGLSLQTVFALALAAAAAALCLYLSRRQAEALGQSYAVSLRHTLYQAIARLPKSRHDERRLGALSLRFVGDLSAARLWFGRGFPNVLIATVVLPGAICILFALDPTLALTGLIPLGLALLGMAAMAWHLEKRHQLLRSRRANVAITMIERIAVAPELDLMGRTDKELRALDDKGHDLAEKAVLRRGRTAGLQAIIQFGLGASGLMVLWSAGQNGVAPATVAACLSVLALLALPLQDLGAAWDQFCAWRVAREKALRLMREPSVKRQRATRGQAPVTVALEGKIDGEAYAFRADPGAATALRGVFADRAARIIAGLDPALDVALTFNGDRGPVQVAYIGDTHIGLQGSLRRSATMSARKRPKDAEISKTLADFRLGDLLADPRGLDQRLAEHGKGLTPAQTLRLDLARAKIGKPDVIVISSVRWHSEPHQEQLLETVLEDKNMTVIVAAPPCPADIGLPRKVK